MDTRPSLSAGPEAIAHDLGNSLMALLGDVERLSLAASDPAIGARALASVRHCAALGRAMMGGDASLGEHSASGHLKLDESIRSDRDLLESALVPLGARATTTGSKLGLDLQATELEIPWAPTTLRRVLVNLAHNARDAYGEEPGSFVVRTVPVEGYVRMDCIDRAGGIADHLKPSVLQPNFTTKAEGTGLGLAIVHELVRGIGGQIELMDTPGGGTTIRFELPARRAASAEAKSAVPGTGQQLLLVEDNVAIRGLLAQELRANGYVVAEAGDAEGAARWLSGVNSEPAVPKRDRPLDVLISDVALPGRSGRELSTEFREQLGELPIVLISAYFDATEPLEVESERLLKPFEPAELTAVVSRLLRV